MKCQYTKCIMKCQFSTVHINLIITYLYIEHFLITFGVNSSDIVLMCVDFVEVRIQSKKRVQNVEGLL
jgi:hypothetical protein